MNEPVARTRIVLRSVEPHVWRRVDVPLSCTLLALHDVIQIAMGWTDSHLFEFRVGERAYGALDLDPELEPRQYKAIRLRLRTLIARGVRRFEYIYDFGDDWQHDVIVEALREGDAEVDYPAFVDGERRCPPEDVGNAEGFMEFLEAALVPGHEHHERMVAWYGRRFDFSDIDERRIRTRLATLARRRRGALTRHRSDRWNAPV